MKASFYFLSLILSLAQAYSPRDEINTLAGRETWDYNELDYDADYIYTNDLEKRTGNNGQTVLRTFCKPDLGISKDQIELKEGTVHLGQTNVFRTHLKFQRSNALDLFYSDSQLAELAKDAFLQMEKQYGNKADKNPAVMTAMFIGKEIFLSSSVKGFKKGRSTLFNAHDQSVKSIIPVEVRNCMTECQQIFLNDGGDESKKAHYNKGACGECMALLYYFQEHPSPTGSSRCEEAVFVTVKRWADDNRVKVLAPCTTPGNGIDPDDVWGCHLVAQVCGARALTDKNLPMESYAIGKEIAPNEESDADWIESERYFTVHQPHLPKEWFIIPVKKESETEKEEKKNNRRRDRLRRHRPRRIRSRRKVTEKTSPSAS